MAKVDPVEKDTMARLIEIMNGKTATEEAKPTIAEPVDDNVAAMKNILERFRQSTDHMLSDSSNDRVLRESLSMQETETGLVIGNYEITFKTDSGRKLYDVVRLGDDTPIAVDLTIYEAARGLAGALNDGMPITSPFIRNLLEMESSYANAIHDAIHSKYALKKRTLAESRRAVIEDKYNAAVRKASHTRSRIMSLVEKYPYQ